jgi:hypothetical protein
MSGCWSWLWQEVPFLVSHVLPRMATQCRRLTFCSMNAHLIVMGAISQLLVEM